MYRYCVCVCIYIYIHIPNKRPTQSVWNHPQGLPAYENDLVKYNFFLMSYISREDTETRQFRCWTALTNCIWRRPFNTLRCAERLPETKRRDSNGAGWIMIELQEMNVRRIFTCHDWLIPFGITENWGFPAKNRGDPIVIPSDPSIVMDDHDD